MSKQAPMEEQGLVLGDRMNWAFILANAVINLHTSIIKVEGEQSEQEVRESALAVFNSIPTAWVTSDEKFLKDLEKCFTEVETDQRMEFCGKKVGKPKIKKEMKLDPWRLYHTCVDVFHRRNLLNKPVFNEVMTGRHFNKPQAGKQTNG